MPVTVCFPWIGNLGNGGKSVLRAAARLNELVAVATARDSSCAVRRFVPRILLALLVYAPPREGAPALPFFWWREKNTRFRISLFPADATPFHFQPGTERALTLTSDLFLRFNSFSSGTIH
jgi:hypothetical protein